MGFVALVVTHVVRRALRPDDRQILHFATLGGVGLALLADTLPRAVLVTDISLGITMAQIGSPFFIWLANARSEANA